MLGILAETMRVATYQDPGVRYVSRPFAAGGASASAHPLQAILKAIALRLDRWKQARAEAQAADALGRLDAHLLRDIGADRADLERLVREGR